jgi:protein-disulfide isomerase
MSKLLTSTLLTATVLSATEVPDNKLLVKYVKRNIVKNPQVKVNGVTLVETKTHKDLPGWTVLLTTMDLTYQKREIHAPEIMFVKDGFVTGHLVKLKNGHDYRNDIKPTVPQSMYDEKHLLFGHKDAAHKILVFSDPMCPFCQEVVPEIFKAAREHPDKIALYYYHLPLMRLHPVSGVLTKVMHIAQNEGKKEIVEKMYTLKIGYREKDTKKILDAVKKQLGYEVTQKQIDAKEVTEALKADEDAAARMMVSGTPTVYVDGEWDKRRDGYKKLID